MRKLTEAQRIKQREAYRKYANSPKGRAKRKQTLKGCQARYIASRGGKERRLRGYLKRAFGITLEQYNAIHDEQGGLCVVCNRPNKKGDRLHVDHNHETGVIRGLLCNECNVSLGFANDNFYRLMQLAGYLLERG